MRVEAILNALEHHTGYFPRGPLREAIARQEEITPHLLALVERATEEIDRVVADEMYVGHLYAFFLLAGFRERRAYPPIVDFFSVPGRVTMDASGYFVTECLGRVLGSVSGGDTGPMLSLAKDASANEYVRAAALDGLLCLVVEEVKGREEVIALFRDLYRGGLERERAYVWDALASKSMDLYPDELMEDIRRAWADDLLDDDFIDMGFVEETLAQGKEVTLARLLDNRHYRLVNDAVAEIEWWFGFEPLPEDLGRNDRCPCGSGLKYKHCCLDRG